MISSRSPPTSLSSGIACPGSIITERRVGLIPNFLVSTSIRTRLSSGCLILRLSPLVRATGATAGTGLVPTVAAHSLQTKIHSHLGLGIDSNPVANQPSRTIRVTSLAATTASISVLTSP